MTLYQQSESSSNSSIPYCLVTVISYFHAARRSCAHEQKVWYRGKHDTYCVATPILGPLLLIALAVPHCAIVLQNVAYSLWNVHSIVDCSWSSSYNVVENPWGAYLHLHPLRPPIIYTLACRILIISHSCIIFCWIKFLPSPATFVLLKISWKKFSPVH